MMMKLEEHLAYSLGQLGNSFETKNRWWHSISLVKCSICKKLWSNKSSHCDVCNLHHRKNTCSGWEAPSELLISTHLVRNGFAPTRETILDLISRLSLNTQKSFPSLSEKITLPSIMDVINGMVPYLIQSKFQGYLPNGPNVYIHFEHFEDGLFANYVGKAKTLGRIEQSQGEIKKCKKKCTTTFVYYTDKRAAIEELLLDNIFFPGNCHSRQIANRPMIKLVKSELKCKIEEFQIRI